MSTTTTPINVGTAPNDGTGDPIRTGGQIINENTLKLFNLSNKIDEGLMSIHKYTGNTDIENIEQNDFVSGVIQIGVVEPTDKFFIVAQYNTGDITDFGTEAGNFNDGSYKTFEFLDQNDVKSIVTTLNLKNVPVVNVADWILTRGIDGLINEISKESLGDVIGLGDYLKNVVEDLTPQLGGNLDLNGKTINGVGNILIDGDGSFTNLLKTEGAFQADGTVRLLSFPNSRNDGAGQNYLFTDGVGTLQSGDATTLKNTKTSQLVNDGENGIDPFITESDQIVLNHIFVDTVSGNDGTGIITNASKPFQTLAVAYANIPNDGTVWTVEFIDGNVTRNCGVPMPAFAFNLHSESEGIFDFSGITGDSDARTAGHKNYTFPNATMLFGGVAKYFGSLTTFNIQAYKIEITCESFNVNTGFFRSTGGFSTVDVDYLEVTSATLKPCGFVGDIFIRKQYQIAPNTNTGGLVGNSGAIFTAYIEEVLLTGNSTLLNLYGIRTELTVKSVNGAFRLNFFESVTNSATTLNLDGITLLNSATIGLISKGTVPVTVKGNIGTETLVVIFGFASTNGAIIFENFIGRLTTTDYTYHTYEFIDCIVEFPNSLLYANNVNGIDFPLGVTFRGHNVSNSESNATELIANVDVATNINDEGTMVTNCTTYGTNITAIRPNISLFENLNVNDGSGIAQFAGRKINFEGFTFDVPNSKVIAPDNADLSSLGLYADDTGAGVGGVLIGFAYINSATGAVHRRLT